MVMLGGLKSAAHLNGQAGVAVAWVAPKVRRFLHSLCIAFAPAGVGVFASQPASVAAARALPRRHSGAARRAQALTRRMAAPCACYGYQANALCEAHNSETHNHTPGTDDAPRLACRVHADGTFAVPTALQAYTHRD